MIIYDFEVFKHDWCMVYLDTEQRKTFEIVNSKSDLQDFYDKYRYQIWVGYNSRGYDQWIAKSILCDFDPYEVSDFIINKDRKGHEFSSLLNKFPILNYDVSVFGRSLKQLEAFMGHDIRETSVPFDIDRKLTDLEMAETLQYCTHDVMETFHVFVENAQDFQTHMDIIKEYKLPITAVSRTQTQLTAMVLGANKRTYDDEFDIKIPDTLRLGKYEWIKDYYLDWAKNSKDYSKMELEAVIAGVKHKLGVGGLHGAIKGHLGDGLYLLIDGDSYYPSLMILYDYFSRSIPEWGKRRFIKMYHHRLELKAQKKKKEQAPHKLILNKTYGGLKDKYNALYDPVQANNICIAGQLFLVDLIDKLEDYCQLIQSNTDGIAIKLNNPEDREIVNAICAEWSERTGIRVGFDEYKRIIQKDVNNYIMVEPNGYIKRIGLYVKNLRNLDNDLPVVNKAIVDYFTKNIPVEVTISKENELINFQKVVKISNKYDYAIYNNTILTDKVYRTFATLGNGHTLLKKHKEKDHGDKMAGTPERCVIINENIEGRKVFPEIDRKWYVDLAEDRIKQFLKG